MQFGDQPAARCIDPQLHASWLALRETGVRRFFDRDPALVRLLRQAYARILNRIATVPWFEIGALQQPSDFLMYTECFQATRPRVIVETGTAGGGSALFYAEALQRIHGHGDFRIVTVERYPAEDMLKLLHGHPQIRCVLGDSGDPKAAAEVRSHIPPGWPVMLTLDSDHGAEHVLAELSQLADLVSPGQYLIVQDTFLGFCGGTSGVDQDAIRDGRGDDVHFDYHGGPLGAVEAFLVVRREFEVDENKQRWLITQHPYGWLRRKGP